MTEKKSPQSKSASGELTRAFHEILVADKRSYEPFVKVFSAIGENVSKLDLGTLVGVFEVDEKNEEAAYIVNFLASVAKKEYFNNPRRGPIESFEAALHKVNVALAELVKHGNVSWLGKLHGTLAVLEKNNLHFSVTGESALLLLRQDQFSEISAGLASEEASLHPLKTFVEVSSGRLLEGDFLILTTPELPALFPLEYLTKQASRMNRDAFRQFLRTALVNEIDMASVLVIEFSKPAPKPKAIPVKRKAEAAQEASSINAFSQATFAKPVTKSAPQTDESLDETLPEEDAPKEEFIDQKTGHIYVQGEELGDLPMKHSIILENLQDAASSLGEFFSHTVRRQGKKTARLSAFLFWEARTYASRLSRKTTQKIHTLQASLVEKNRLRQIEQAEKREAAAQAKEARLMEERLLAERQAEEQAKEERERAERAPLPPIPPVIEEVRKPATPVVIEPEPAVIEEVATPTPSFRPTSKATSHIERFRSLYEKGSASEEKKMTSPAAHTPAPKNKQKKTHAPSPSVLEKLSSFVTRLKKNVTPVITQSLAFLIARKMLVIGIIAIVIFSLAVGSYLLGRKSTTDTPVAQEMKIPETSSPTPSGSSPSNTLKAESTIPLGKDLVTLTYLDHQAYAATSKSIVSLDDNKEYPLTDMKGEIRFVAAMEDLSLLFILSSQNELFAWSPLNKAFTKNELVLPANARVTAIGTYLTYLYVLDRGNNQLYRYPRSENAFKDATPWMKDSFELTDTAFLAINETVALAPSREHLLSFSQGKNNGTFVESDDTHQVAIQALTTDNDFPFIYALDDKSTLSVWNLERKPLHAYTLSDAPASPTSLAVDPEKKTLLVGNRDGNITRYTNVVSE